MRRSKLERRGREGENVLWLASVSGIMPPLSLSLSLSALLSLSIYQLPSSLPQ